MTRRDRLTRLMQLLKSGGSHRAADMAAELGVTVRTLYRDMDRLRAAGVPVEGHRGTGYRITASITLPPLNLTPEELEALQIGLVAVTRSGDAALAEAADTLAAKLDAALPEDGRAPPGALPLDSAADAAPWLAVLRRAIRARQKLRLVAEGKEHELRPLRLDFWGRLWTLSGWSETEGRFVELALERIDDLEVLPNLFIEEPGRSASDLPR